jgi:hypothetical protein
MLNKLDLHNICLFDVDAVDIDRFFVKPLNLEQYPKLILIDEPNEYYAYKRNGRFRDAQVICSAYLSIFQLSSLFKLNKIEYLLINAHRIIDVHIILAARKAGCKVVYIQHGMYVPFMKRDFAFFFNKLKKTLRYLLYAFEIGVYCKTIRLPAYLFSIHVLGGSRSVLTKYSILFPDYSLVFSVYWELWHKKYYGFPSDTKFLHIGFPDLNKFTFDEFTDSNRISYCYQTLVEDGRIPRQQMYDFYTDLSEFCNREGFRCVVKWHPRGNIEIADDLKVKFGFDVIEDFIPNTNIVVGHYSSLLAFWGSFARCVICVELPGHGIDESISPWVNVVNSLNNINISNLVESDPNVCVKYFGPMLSKESIIKKINNFI